MNSFNFPLTFAAIVMFFVVVLASTLGDDPVTPATYGVQTHVEDCDLEDRLEGDWDCF